MPSGRAKALWWGAAGLGVYLAARKAWRKEHAIDFRGKNVLITGGSRGLGLVMAREFLRRGARVAVCARDPAELERALQDLIRYGRLVLAIPCDVADREQVEDMVRTVQDQLGAIDVLVNNAAVIQVAPALEMTLADYEEAMGINFWGALHTIFAVLPAMRRRRQGRIVNICSIGGKVSIPHLLPYTASKFALTGFSEGLHAELARYGVVVTTVCPHLMRTGSPVNATFKGKHRAEHAWFSIGDALPLVSMSAGRAARRIVTACANGEAEVILTLQANVAARLFALFPGTSATALGLVNRLLPGPGGIGTRRASGRESESAISPSPVTALGDRAARENNENP